MTLSQVHARYIAGLPEVDATPRQRASRKPAASPGARHHAAICPEHQHRPSDAQRGSVLRPHKQRQLRTVDRRSRP